MFVIPSKVLGAIFLCLLCILPLSSQNLIKNPSFEEFVNCPGHLDNFDADVLSWSTPTAGSTDYFNACSKTMGTPKNFNGEQASDFGRSYAGFYMYAPDDYREYLQAELIEPLVEGREYQVSFFVSLAERSDFAVKEFGVLFAKNKMDIPIKKELSKRHWYRQKGNSYHFLEIGNTDFYSDTKNWIPVRSRFTAKGTERFMILGNFGNNARTRKFKTKRNAQQGAYYYVDRFEVITVDSFDRSSEVNPDAITDDGKGSFDLDKINVFGNLLFDFDHFRILEKGRLELRRISDYLKTHPDLHIMIKGHTDSVGTEKHNRLLSGKRAETVADYLMQTGISKKRIRWYGHGDEKPIASNATDEGRKRNRRVEFVINNPNIP